MNSFLSHGFYFCDLCLGVALGCLSLGIGCGCAGVGSGGNLLGRLGFSLGGSGGLFFSLGNGLSGPEFSGKVADFAFLVI